MTLDLKLSGSVEPFVNYLKGFARIRTSLLLEIDVKQRMFVAKTFSENRSSIKFSAISFDACNINVVSNDDEELGDKRIKLAILTQLPRFISMVSRFGEDSNDKDKCDFNIVVEYVCMPTAGIEEDFVAQSVLFKSEKFDMEFSGFRVSEFRYMSDEKFYKFIFNVEDPIKFEMSASDVASIIKTSEITKTDDKKDTLVFYVKDKDVKVKNGLAGGGKPSIGAFNQKIAQLEEAPNYDIEVVTYRKMFLDMMSKCDDDYNVVIGRRQKKSGDGYVVDRIMFDSKTNDMKVVISIVNN